MSRRQDIKILLVDDDPAVIDHLVNLLPSLGFETDTARKSDEAVKKLQQDFYPIVLTDMVMPDMDGMDLLKHISSNYPRTRIIAVTGSSRNFSYTEVIRAGASDFISKPFNTDELEAKINRLIREISLVRQLEHLSISDGLTGLYNRRYFDTKINEEARRAHRQNHELYLAVIDVDHLKIINDKYGHLVGDKLLKLVADTIRQCIRENVDWPFRFGGDEYCVIVTQVSHDQALMTAERILKNFNEHKPEQTGLSIGLARFVRSDDRNWSDDIDDLVKRADLALYKAKQTGRNRIVTDSENDRSPSE